jgi:Mrp family chromosome partitioning ATPase
MTGPGRDTRDPQERAPEQPGQVRDGPLRPGELARFAPAAGAAGGRERIMGQEPAGVPAPGADAAASYGLASLEQIDAFRDLRTKLMLMAAGEKLQHFTTMVVGVNESSDASFVARNLAAAFTLQDHPALLIECNFRSTTRHGFIGPGADAEGLYDFLIDASNPSAILPIWPTVINGLRLIPSGRCNRTIAAQREILSSQPMRELMAKLRSWPLYVVLDSPPVNGSPDARILSDLADFVVLVVGYGSVSNATIARAAAAFDRRKVAGVVLNEHSVSRGPGSP